MKPEKNSWESKTFGDCAVLVREVCSPAEARGVPYVGLEHIEPDGLRLLGHGFGEDVTSTKSRFLCRDILFGKLRPYFRKVVQARFDGVCSTDIWVVRAAPGIEQRFLFYWMASPEFVEVATRGSEGTKMPRAKWDFVGRVRRGIPPQIEQRAIADILGTLDDKIELNRRMNASLEAMARAIFKSWFVDFDPVHAKMVGRQPPGMGAEMASLVPDSFEDSPLGKIPRGWRTGVVADGIEIMGGGTPDTSVAEYWNGDVPWFSIVDAPPPSDIWVIDTEKKISQAGLDNSSARLLPTGTTIISARGTVGKCALVGRPMTMNQSCYGIRGTNKRGDYFTYLTIRNEVSDLQQQTHGSVFDTITRATFQGIDTVIPPVQLTRLFDKSVEPLMLRILANLKESRILAGMRDTLLPKLLSGEIRVKDAEKVAGQVT
jgi:type I restriction enzyme S subunit